MHRWVRGSVAQWLEPSIHKQLLILTNLFLIKKERRKRKKIKESGKENKNKEKEEECRSKKRRKNMATACRLKTGADFQVQKKRRSEGQRREKGRLEGEGQQKKGFHYKLLLVCN